MSSLQQNLQTVLLLASIPVGVEFGFALLGLVDRPAPSVLSALQHGAAGVITAAVALELVPLLLSRFSSSASNWLALILGFCGALVIFSLLARLLPEEDDGDEGDQKRKQAHDKESLPTATSINTPGASVETLPLVKRSVHLGWRSLPWGILAPLAVDTFLDGFLLALAATGDHRAG